MNSSSRSPDTLPKVHFINLSRSFFEDPDHGRPLGRLWPVRERKVSWRNLLASNYTSIMRWLAQRGYAAEYVSMVSQSWMRAKRFRGALATNTVDDLRCVWASSFAAFSKTLSPRSVLMLRNDYPEFEPLLRMNPEHKVIVLSIRSDMLPENLECDRREGLFVFVNREGERAAFEACGISSEIFLKAAAAPFYSSTRASRLDYDGIFVARDLWKPSKRLELLLEALQVLDGELAKKPGEPVRFRLALVGRARDNLASALESLAQLANVSVEYLGHLAVPQLVDLFSRSRFLFCTSGKDPNPRVIVEALASDVPVLCTSDLTCGREQIVSECGRFVEPSPEAIARGALEMLEAAGGFEARRHSIRLEDSGLQIARALERLGC